MKIEGTVALVTGGQSGLGAATARELVRRGASVVALDLHRDGIDGVPGIESVAGDVRSPEDVARAIERAVARGPLSILVNCAGVGSNERIAKRGRDGSGQSGDLEAFRRVIDINLIGTFNCMRLFAAAVAERGAPDDETHGVIVNTASIAAFEGQVGQAAYSASKAAIVALSLTAARDLAPLGIRVMSIAPGMMETPLLGTVRSDVRDGLVKSMVYPRRIGYPEEFAALALHCVDNDYLNGPTIRIDAAARLPHQT